MAAPVALAAALRRGEGGGERLRAALLTGGLVCSHWDLDWLVHPGTMPLWGNQYKTGLGLWRPALAYALETAIFLAGLGLYLRATTPDGSFAGRYGMALFAGAVALANAPMDFGPPLRGVKLLAAFTLASYLAQAAVAGWLDWKRRAA